MVKRVYDKIIDGFSLLLFVKILNVENREMFLEFYVLLVIIVSCFEFIVISIYSFKDKVIEEKIKNLKMLIGIKILFYEWWFFVVDNVISLFDMLGFFFEFGNE